jgi:tight adherence protein B
MTASLGILVLILGGMGATVLWYRERARRYAAVRLDGLLRHEMAATPAEERVAARAEPLRTFPPRYRPVSVVAGVMVTAGTNVWGFPLEVSVALGCLIGVVAYLIEETVAEQRTARIETQLADAIDLLVGALRAGAALLAALEASLRESRDPLRTYLQDVVTRIRLGDDPREVLAELPARVPLETFRLFAMALAVHWEVGGSLASTLSTVGRTIRDRVELSRRVQAQGIEAHVSVAAVVVIAYVLAFLMWRTNPERMELFVQSGVGTELVTAVIGLQAIGLVWMSRISRSGS